jgi:hypothetical protein
VFGEDPVAAERAAMPDWRSIRGWVLHGRPAVEAADLEDACARVVARIERLAQWAAQRAPSGYDGLGPLAELGIRIEESAEGALRLVEIPSVADADPAWPAFLAGTSGPGACA